MGSNSAQDSAIDRPNACVLMFSGGRDSSLAALRLCEQGRPLTLVTVSSDHLFGIDRVRQRLAELASVLPADTKWIRIRQPRTGASFGAAFGQTCLPCQHDYALAGALIAGRLGISDLAFGYASYQSSWPEQHPTATRALKVALGSVGITLCLPVYDLASRDDARRQLMAAGFSDEALEQKCSKQVFNIALDDDKLSAHLAHWASELIASLQSEVEVPILEEGVLGKFLTQ